MTYLTFLLVFLVPPIILLLLLRKRPSAGIESRRTNVALPLTAVIAVGYTTPWDNYLVYRGVWYYGADRVLGTIGYVPVEEYVFFVLQPIMTGLLVYRMLEYMPRPRAATNGGARVLGTLVYLAFAVAGILFLLSGIDRALYMGLILAWACPVLAAMWAWGGDHFLEYRHVLFPAVAMATGYLWIADRVAIGLGIWDIATQYSFDYRPFGLPIEEAAFFLITNLLVVQGVLLFLHGDIIYARRMESADGTAT